MSKLKQVVAKSFATKYAWPKGWLTREQAADDLECSPERVDEILRLPIQDGSVSKEHFPVWNPKLERVVKQPGYRVNSDSPAASAPPTRTEEPLTPEREEAIRRIGTNCGENPDPKRVQKNLPKGLRGTVSLAQIRAVLGLV